MHHARRGGQEGRLRAAVVRNRRDGLGGHRVHRLPPETGRGQAPVETLEERRHRASRPAHVGRECRIPGRDRGRRRALRHPREPVLRSPGGESPEDPARGRRHLLRIPNDQPHQRGRRLPVSLHLLEKRAQRGRVRRVEHPGVREREDQQAKRGGSEPLLHLEQRRVRLRAVGRLQQDEPGRGAPLADEERTQRAVRVERSEDVEAGAADPPRRDEPEHSVHEHGPRRREAPSRIRDPLRLARGARGEGHRVPRPGNRIRVRQVAGDPGGRVDPEAPPQPLFPKGMDAQPDPVAEDGNPPGQPEEERDREPPDVIRATSKRGSQ